MASARLGLVLAAAAAACQVLGSFASEATATSETCLKWMTNYSLDELASVELKNCARVTRAVKQLNKMSQTVDEEQRQDWRIRTENAQKWCNESKAQHKLRNIRKAAELAVKAFGTGIMKDQLCCTRLQPPFCIIPAESDVALTVRTPAGILLLAGIVLALLVCVGGAFESCRKRRQAEHRGFQDVAEDEFEESAAAPGPLMETVSLTLELQQDWLHGSCLRVMPGAHRMAASSASLFGALCATFEFQRDSVRNQYEHLLSLWRSHCAIVADRRAGGADSDGDQVDERYLLAEALDDLHTELLNGFVQWRAKFRAVTSTRMADAGREGAVPRAGGVEWEHIARALCPDRSEGEATERSRQLVEVAVYLLVWGECGNLRFMPELVYLITELALASEGPGGPGFYGGDEAGGSTGRSGRFLVRIIRPIYTLVFDEWYKEVHINKKGGDTKVLHKDFERYLLPDVANYDDWNEFFCDPSQVAKFILCKDGRDLFELPHGQRFAELPNVHWHASLKGSQIKTHRECHSLWGVFAATHRVWLLHALVFALGAVIGTGFIQQKRTGMDGPILGTSMPVRLAVIGLLVPIHAVLWALARLETTSNHVMKLTCGFCFCLSSVLWAVLFAAPIATYALVRATENRTSALVGTMILHFAVSVAGVFFLLFAPAKKADLLFKLTPVPLWLRILRYFFWLVIFAVKFLFLLKIVETMWNSMQMVNLVRFGRQSPTEISELWRTSNWSSSFYEWALLWMLAFYLFCSDTLMWFQLGCTILGVATFFAQRGCLFCEFAFKDDIQKIPERFSQVVLSYSQGVKRSGISEFFPPLWDRVVAYMRYEDKCESGSAGEMAYRSTSAAGLAWEGLSKPLAPYHDLSRQPEMFGDQLNVVEVCFRNYFGWKEALQNADLKWRLLALARSLSLPAPRPFRAPYIPGITVLVPHYGETIVMSKSELFDHGGYDQSRKSEVPFGCCKMRVRETVPLIDWLRARYSDEYRAFSNRMEARGDWPSGVPWDEYEDRHWEQIRVWASMRMQTLWRTVAGMCLYHPALQAHYEAQKVGRSVLAQENVWNPSDCFTCLVSMQIYKQFNKSKLSETNKMFNKFPESLKVAYIDWEDLFSRGGDDAARQKEQARMDRVHGRQARRYWSCLIDKTCKERSDLRREPKYRIELPGFPILGDGKSDNQNHAIPFMRGTFCQCIDANQGAYFEQMLFLPCVLGEFRTRARGDSRARRIIGLPEHITSDIGSIGDFAAGAEITFGTISQRSFAVLGGRMHYGHPDIMNKEFMMQQGGVSKATKTINLSEDIFAGMDFTLRGDGRRIRHCEYFHLAKGRDLGFNAVLGFFAKLSNGTGEQLLTRQMLRLSHVLHLPECLTFYYAHGGYYITQYFVSLSMPVLVFVWLLVLCGDCNTKLEVFFPFECTTPAADAMATLLTTFFSVYIIFFLLAPSLLLFAEIWTERSFGAALYRLLSQIFSCSFLLFIFQAKIIGFYIMAEIRQGGAGYIATGRGLPTERRDFVGTPRRNFFALSLYLRNLDTDRLMASTELCGPAMEAMCSAVVAASGSTSLRVEDVTASIQGAGRVAIEVTVGPQVTGTTAIKAKLGSEAVGSEVGKHLGRVEGIEEICGGDVAVTGILDEARSSWRIDSEAVGGLYLDYTKHTYYDAMNLLIFTLLLLVAGGYSEVQNDGSRRGLVFTFLVLALVIFSWLYAPFMFNPYQFSASYLMDDFKAWYGFFFTEGSKNWIDWYERNVIKPRRGLRKSVFDFGLIFMFFAVTAWVSQLSARQHIYMAIFTMSGTLRYATVASLIPPFVLSFIYCGMLALVRSCKRAARSCRQAGGVSCLSVRTSAEASSGDSCSSSDAERPVEEECVPLAWSAAIVVCLQVVEVIVPLSLCMVVRDRKMWTAGIVVKFMFWKIFLFLLESALSMKHCCQCVKRAVPPVQETVQLLVYSNQIARDIFVSTFIGVTLTPWVFLTALNDLCCPRWSVHQALIYRTFGPLAKRRSLVRNHEDSHDFDEEAPLDADAGGGGGSSSDGAAGQPGMTGSPPTATMPMSTLGLPPGASETMHVMRPREGATASASASASSA